MARTAKPKQAKTLEQRLTEHLSAVGETGLDERLAIIPVGGADNLSAFVALMGRRLRVSALVDGAGTSRQITRAKAAASHNGVDTSHIVAVAEIDDALPSNADMEDLFDTEDYLRLYNWAFDSNLSLNDLAQTSEPILKKVADAREGFDHALPAHALTAHKAEFFANIRPATVDRFRKLFQRLNETVEQGLS